MYGTAHAKAIPPCAIKTDHTLAIVDPATGKVLAKMPVGADPHEVIASADGKTAYVSIYGGGSFHEINIIDLVGQKALATVDTKPLMGRMDLISRVEKFGFRQKDQKLWGPTIRRPTKLTGQWERGKTGHI